MMLLLLACGQGKDSADAPGTESGATVADTGWQVEEAAGCAEPQALSYAEGWPEGAAPEVYAPPTSTEYPGIEPGGMALMETAAGRLLLYVQADTGVGILNLDTGARSLALAGRFGTGSFSVGDLDGNGVPDLVLAGVMTSILWDFDGESIELTDINPGGEGFVRDPALADFDGDGDLDLLLNRTSPLTDTASVQSLMVWNLGGRAFSAPEPLVVPEGYWGKVFDATVLDMDGDNAPDVYLCNDLGVVYAPNALLMNDGAGTLSPATDARGLDFRSSCMGEAWGDLNRDGTLDLVMGDALRLWLFEQDSLGFIDTSNEVDLSLAPAAQMLWGVAPADMDNDGHTDLVLPSSWFWVSDAVFWPAYLYLQTESADGGAWTESGAGLGLPQSAGTRSVLTPDLNGDGTPDILLGDGWRSPHILLSEGCTEGAWVEISAPSGSTAIVEAGGLRRAALITADGSFASAQPAVAHIGLGDAATIDRIIVRVPWRGALVLAGPIPVRSRVRVPL